MQTSLTNRRQFLQHAGLVASGAIGLTAASSAKLLPAIEPIVRLAGNKFKFSLAAYSYRELLKPKTGKPQVTIEDFVTDCAKLGLEGTELTSYYLPAEPTPTYLRDLKQLCFRSGLDVSGTAIRNDFCFPPGPQRDAELQHVKRWVDHAEILGAPCIRIFSGMPHKQPVDEARKLAIAGLEECCQYAGERGVYLALENHGGLSTLADDLLSIAKDVQSPWFAINLDTGNFHSDDIYGDLAKLAPYAVNVQVKVAVSGPDGKKQPADFSRLAQIMRDAGYRGYIVLEFEEQEDPRVACPRYMDAMRKAFMAVG